MTVEEQGVYLKIIEDDFKGMKNMLDSIRDSITQYPVYTQLEFIKPLKHIILEAWSDAKNPTDSFLNLENDEEDKIKI